MLTSCREAPRGVEFGAGRLWPAEPDPGDRAETHRLLVAWRRCAPSFFAVVLRFEVFGHGLASLVPTRVESMPAKGLEHAVEDFFDCIVCGVPSPFLRRRAVIVHARNSSRKAAGMAPGSAHLGGSSSIDSPVRLASIETARNSFSPYAGLRGETRAGSEAAAESDSHCQWCRHGLPAPAAGPLPEPPAGGFLT